MNGIITRALPKDRVEVTVANSAACEGCPSCAGCNVRKTLTVTAKNVSNAKVGDAVTLERHKLFQLKATPQTP